MDGFRRSDHQAILACLTDDVVWRIHGARTTRGKAEFDAEIGAPGFEGSPDLSIERLISEVDSYMVAVP
ncbi:nuclear transport factor 2 family protein [Arthrobacter sp. Sa2BUA2]|uniref:Nuclear transport factor 2 family protein n=2 Tax=Arthrobacter pullicola TaxID=2762224 RepID=A0ABR8YEK5_9MICC|nr:nuclear transport factor 2 family protein [Arthrobacter pullicola]